VERLANALAAAGLCAPRNERAETCHP
jgi:hypothetical protein